jgi:hypothetical protein
MGLARISVLMNKRLSIFRRIAFCLKRKALYLFFDDHHRGRVKSVALISLVTVF